MNTKLIKNPRITEKASTVIGQNVYTFDISTGANKTEIKKAIFSLYKVRPIRVNVVAVPHKRVPAGRGKMGTKGGGRKAYVYLKAGDKIEII
ncbi:MAG TPA: 50S ribosomal protein L23 [Candidatus Paceibacterota bacterium]